MEVQQRYRQIKELSHLEALCKLKMIDECANRKDGDYSEEDNIFYTRIKQVSISSISSMEGEVTIPINGRLLVSCWLHLKLYLMH